MAAPAIAAPARELVPHADFGENTTSALTAKSKVSINIIV